MTISFELRGQQELERKLTPDLYLPAVHTLLKEASIYATREAQSGAQRDVGAIARTITAEVRSPMDIRIRSSHPGVVAAEFGRRAGAPAPPMSALRGWAERHGMRGLEFVLARAIARRGVKGLFFMRKARERLAQTEMPRLLRTAAYEIERKWVR
jgi:hypothetical protein